METVIAIIGGGASSLAFIHQYLARLGDTPKLPRTLYLFEKQRSFGPGAAYSHDVDSNLLNTKTAYITPFADKPGDFNAWLAECEAFWRPRFQQFVPTPESYAPRPLFGLYLQHRMSQLIGRAAAAGLRIVQINEEVRDVVRSHHGHVLKTDGNLAFMVDHVFMLCGTLPERQPRGFIGNARLLAHPYPIADLPKKVPSAASVAIIGARLSCIDAVIGLVESGHRGPIAIHSRSGYFPCVRGTQGRITPQFLNAESIQALRASKGSLTLQDILRLVRREIAHCAGLPLDAVPALLAPPPPDCLVTFLMQEIEAAQSDRVWQAVLYATNGVIELLWDALCAEDKATLLDKYMSAFMAYRVSIPAENARKILAYLQRGQLSFHAGPFDLEAQGDGRPRLVSRTDPCRSRSYDFVIQAKGSPRKAQDLDSDCIANMLRRGDLSPNVWGGLQIDAATYQAIDAAGMRTPTLRVIGELSSGTFFFTSALDIGARHARQCVDAFCSSLAAEQAPARERAVSIA